MSYKKNLFYLVEVKDLTFRFYGHYKKPTIRVPYEPNSVLQWISCFSRASCDAQIKKPAHLLWAGYYDIIWPKFGFDYSYVMKQESPKCFTKRSPSLFFHIPFSIFYQFFISNSWANYSDVGFRNDSHLPSNFFQPPFDSAEGATALGHCLITGVNRIQIPGKKM